MLKVEVKSEGMDTNSSKASRSSKRRAFAFRDTRMSTAGSRVIKVRDPISDR